MRRPLVGLVGLALALQPDRSTAVPPPRRARCRRSRAGPASVSNGTVHDLPNPLEDKRRALRQQALTSVISGDARLSPRTAAPSSTSAPARRRRPPTPARAAGRRRTTATGPTTTSSWRAEKTDKIFVILAEFGNERDPRYPDQDTDPDTPGPTVFDGPLHNAIPQPAPNDNSTVWQPDYDQAYYQDLYFGSGAGVESVKTYYERQSSGRYSVDGTVSDWVKVRYNEARYGRSDGFPCASNVCSNTWDLVRDARERSGSPTRRRRAGRTRRSRPTSPRTTSGTATTSTATATSTSRTATSTTSRSSTPAATRPTATRSRARTPSGATAGTPSRATSAPTRPGRRAARRHPGRRHRHLDRRLHRSSPRTAACRSSSTSTATTSACRTTTTPPAARTTASTGGPSWRRAGLGAGRPGHRHPRRRPVRVGQAPARLVRLRGRRGRHEEEARASARTSTTPRSRRASWSCCPTRSVTQDLVPPDRRGVRGGPGRATTSTTP